MGEHSLSVMCTAGLDLRRLTAICWAGQVAELELLLGSSKGSVNVDPVAAVEILQKLLANISRTDRTRLKEYGRRCEGAMADILLRGTPHPVRAQQAS